MDSRRLPTRRFWAPIAAVGCLLLPGPPSALALPEVVAASDLPSSISAEFGPAVPLGAPATPGLIAAPTGNGIDLYDTAQPSVPRVGCFHTAGEVRRASASGSIVFLFAGSRGVVAVDVSNPSDPVAAGSIGGLGRIATGAASASGGGVLAAVDSALHFLTWDPGAGFSLRRTVVFGDGRRASAMASRGDSFLVAWTRPGAPSRLTFTLYRLQAGATQPDSLGEFAFNAHEALDLAWRGSLAFVADGSRGVLVVDVTSRSIVRQVPVLGSKQVRSLDVNDTVVVVAAEGTTFARYSRAGSAGDSLVEEPVRILGGDPLHVRLSGDFAVVATYDQIDVAAPDETGRSMLELVSLSGGAEPSLIGGTGRTRRVVTEGALAYVADYTGGLRIYYGTGTDTSLVGVFSPSGNSRAVDIALDPARSLVYLASGPGGLEVIDVQDPASPQAVSSLFLPGLASGVTVAGPNLVAVARRGLNAGVTFVDVADPAAPQPHGSVNFPFIQDPRALAARDTVLFVADEVLGLVSIRFGNPDLPATVGPPSGFAARDLDLAGTQLLVATRARGLQVVDVVDPTFPILRGEFVTPPLLGVTRNGSSAALFLGEPGVLVVDVSVPSAIRALGPIAVPGIARDGSWTGSRLLVTASLSLERFQVTLGPASSLAVTLELGTALPRARISWAPFAVPGLVGFNLYRDLGSLTGGSDVPTGRRVNRNLLPSTATETFDDSLVAGQEHHYRLEAYFADGSSTKVAEGSLFVSSAPRTGRPYPNPYRAQNGARASLSYVLPAGTSPNRLTLRIYSVSGRLVRTVETLSQISGGFGTVTWDGRDDSGRAVPGGRYYLRLNGAGIDESRAITLLR